MGRRRISVWSVRLTDTIRGDSMRSQRFVESRIGLVGDGGIFGQRQRCLRWSHSVGKGRADAGNLVELRVWWDRHMFGMYNTH